MQIGKAIRLERITRRANGRTVIVPMDHGVTVGPIEGLVDMPAAVDKVATGGADAVLGHVGLPRLGHRGYGQDIGLILHLGGPVAAGLSAPATFVAAAACYAILLRRQRAAEA